MNEFSSPVPPYAYAAPSPISIYEGQTRFFPDSIFYLSLIHVAAHTLFELAFLFLIIIASPDVSSVLSPPCSIALNFCFWLPS